MTLVRKGSVIGVQRKRRIEMYPYWYERQMKIEKRVMLLGMILLSLSWVYGSALAVIGWIMIISGPVFQHLRFKRLKRLRDDPLRCECGGHFVLPSELGFDDVGVLICDNESGLGPLGPCTNWIVMPPDYHSSEGSAKND